jgi:site-specific DNA recombinase
LNKCQEILNKRRNEMSDSQHHAKHYCYRYTFSSKIECGICGASYVHRISGKQKEKQYFYWSCYDKVSLKEKCPKSLTIREDILKEMFVEVYNSITTQKHKTRDKLINAIKETITSEDNKKELSRLYNEAKTLQKRLSNLIDLKLDNMENKDVYNEKEKEISNKIKILIEELDDVKFENLVEKIIIGEKDIDGNVNPNTIRFVLKISTEYKFKDLSFVPNNKTRNN